MSSGGERVLSARKFIGLSMGTGPDGKTPTLSLGLIPPVQPAEARLVGLKAQDASLLAEQLDAAAAALATHLAASGRKPLGASA